jgi:hypothetical protein
VISNVGVWSAIAGIITAVCLLVAALLAILYRVDRINDDVEAIRRRIDPEPATTNDDVETYAAAEDPPAVLRCGLCKGTGIVGWQASTGAPVLDAECPDCKGDGTPASVRIERSRRTYRAITDMRNQLENGGLI